MDKKKFDREKDRETAIKNLGGLTALYEKHLARFKIKYKNIDEEILNAINENDAEEARRLAHSIKGLSATLGLMALSTAALELEALLKLAIISGLSGEPLRSDISSALDTFREELNEVTSEPANN